MTSRTWEESGAAGVGSAASSLLPAVVVAHALAELAAPLRKRLARTGSVSVIAGAAAPCQEFVEQATRIGAAVVLLPDADADALMFSDMSCCNWLPILVVGNADEHRALELARAGFAGVVERRAGTAMIARAVAALMGGDMWFSRAVLSAVLRELWKVSRAPELTARERDILRLISAGLKNRMIAAELGISYETVRWHIRRLNAKLQARGGFEAGAAGDCAARRTAAAASDAN